MSKITKTTQIIEKIVKEEIPAITITLSYDEARVLKAIFSRVTGPISGPRNIIDIINDQMRSAHIYQSNNNDVVSGEIHFSQSTMEQFINQFDSRS